MQDDKKFSRTNQIIKIKKNMQRSSVDLRKTPS